MCECMLFLCHAHRGQKRTLGPFGAGVASPLTCMLGYELRFSGRVARAINLQLLTLQPQTARFKTKCSNTMQSKSTMN